MFPTAPVLPAGGPGPAPLVDVNKTLAATQSSPPAASPALGSAAVTQADATRLPPLQSKGPALQEVPEIPPDPPPVKGLGIPPLNTTQVGDLDKIETPPPVPSDANPMAPAITDLLAALQPPAAPGFDRRA